MAVTLTKDQVQKCIPRPKPAKKQEIYDAYVAAFTSDKGRDVFSKFKINDSARRMAHFLAQAAEETGGLTLVRESLFYTTVKAVRAAFGSRAAKRSDQWITDNLLRNELAMGKWAYNGRMGNKTGSTDGFDYRGGGTFQTTGRNAYRDKGKLAKVDLEGNPKLIEDPLITLLAACAEWDDLGCNALADKDEIRKISRGINRGSVNSKFPANGEEERIKWFKKISKVLQPADG
jgi:predicted chitinase